MWQSFVDQYDVVSFLALLAGYRVMMRLLLAEMGSCQRSWRMQIVVLERQVRYTRSSEV